MIDSFVVALGGADQVTLPMMIEIAREADLVLIAEMARATALRGGEVDLGDLAPTTVVRSSGQRLGAAYHGRWEVEFVEWFPMRFDGG